MPDERPPHLWIPSNRVSTEPYQATGFPPSYHRENNADHGRRLIASYTAVREVVATRPDAGLTTDLVLQVVTPREVSARSERAHLEKLGFDIVAYSTRAPNLATGIISKPDFEALQARLEAYTTRATHPGKTYLAPLEDFGEVPAEDKIAEELLGGDVNEPLDCMIALYTSLSKRDKLAVANAIATNLRDLQRGERPANSESVAIWEYDNGTVIVTAPLTPEQILDIGTNYVTVRSIVPNDDIVTTRAVAVSTLPQGVQISPPVITSPVAVVDSGVNSNCELLRGLVVQQMPTLPAGAVKAHDEHGTFVASRVVYGDDLDRQLQSPPLLPCCPVVDVPVIGFTSGGLLLQPKEADLISVIQTVVPQLAPGVRVFNLSVGPPARVGTGVYSEIAKMVDYLSRKHDVLFVVAVGNITRPASSPPTHFAHSTARMQAPSEALLALTVGSFAKYTDAGALAGEREVSPFSRRGPGADDGQKPDLVAHGGNLLAATWMPTQRIGTYGVYGDGLQLACDAGTSFAAPLVSQAAARLFAAYPGATTNLVRALLCHFCDSIYAPDVAGCPPEHLRGFGEPIVNRALFSTQYAATYLYQGQIAKDAVQHVPFVVPSTLAAVDSRKKVRIRATVVYDPPVNPDNPLEYSQCRLVAKLYKRVQVGFRGLADGPKAVGKAWNPVIHLNATLSKAYETGEWELRLRLITRGKLPGTFEQRFSAVIEVIDERSGTNVRNDVLNETAGMFLPVQLLTAAA